MKKRMIGLVVMLLVACMVLTSCSSESTEEWYYAPPESVSEEENVETGAETTSVPTDESTEEWYYAPPESNEEWYYAPPESNEEESTEPEDTSDMYEWTVGNGHVLRTHINVMEYIDGDSIRMSDMARDLGFGDWEAMMALEAPEGFKRITEDDTITLRFGVKWGEAATSLIAWTNAGSDAFIQYWGYEPCASYKINGCDKEVGIDLIICFAYACESYAAGRYMPFEGMLPTHGEINYGLD